MSEAIRDAARETLRKAAAISIQLDEPNSRLLVKYHACNHDLQVRVGVLALFFAECWGDGAGNGSWRASNCQLDMWTAGAG